MSKYTLIPALFVFSAYVSSEGFTPTNGHKITSVFSGYTSKEAYFEISGAGVNPAACGAPNGPIAVDPQKSDVGHVLSLLLYAHATDKAVDLQLYDESCLGVHRVLRRIKVKKS